MIKSSRQIIGKLLINSDRTFTGEKDAGKTDNLLDGLIWNVRGTDIVELIRSQVETKQIYTAI